MKLGGRMSISEYFADLTLKKQVAVTSLIETQVIVADFILVSLRPFDRRSNSDVRA